MDFEITVAERFDEAFKCAAHDLDSKQAYMAFCSGFRNNKLENMFSTLTYTMKTHKKCGEVKIRGVHSSTMPPF
eukprot:10952808-Karenia_brevis.AAC.1